MPDGMINVDYDDNGNPRSWGVAKAKIDRAKIEEQAAAQVRVAEYVREYIKVCVPDVDEEQLEEAVDNVVNAMNDEVEQMEKWS